MIKSNYGNLYWRVIYGCNANCFMCLGEHSGRVVKGYEKKLLEGARELGFKTIVLTGGEPTLRKDLPSLIRISADYGFNTRLDTNGIIVDRDYLLSIKNYLYLLGLPLHGHNAKLHDSISGVKGHFKLLGKGAAIARELNIPLKITTAVSKRNIKEIENIASYLAAEIHPSIYALNGLVKRSMSSAMFNEYCLGESEFDSMRERLLKNDYPFKLSFCSGHKESDRAYIFVNPDFTVSITKAESEETVGDLKTEDLKSILEKVELDYQLHLERSEATNLKVMP